MDLLTFLFDFITNPILTQLKFTIVTKINFELKLTQNQVTNPEL